MDMVNVVKECAERVLKEVARSDKINILNIAGHLRRAQPDRLPVDRMARA